ncbi:MAG: tRNA 2-selenouridine(34) synthase MnmH [Rhodocyclaceae bacterium]
MERGYANLAQLAGFDEIIDARSPAEFADDHLPRARSCPVLDDEERARIGTLYKQVSPFAARRLGAVLAARNIARHIEANFLERGRSWRPLVYCWRGGKRSGAFVTILREIGWDACQLEGGYKAYRRHVLSELERLPGLLRLRVVSGRTGSAKSRLLHALAERGAQVLDLEALAGHRGSVLGESPADPQPSQRMFETRLAEALSRLDPARDVFVEAESRRIGSIQLPNALIDAMRAAECLRIEAAVDVRVRYLLEDYAHFIAAPERLKARLAGLRELRGAETVARWCALADRGEWAALVSSLLERHYDPLYERSQERNYLRFHSALRLPAEDLSAETLGRLADRVLAGAPSPMPDPSPPPPVSSPARPGR